MDHGITTGTDSASSNFQRQDVPHYASKAYPTGSNTLKQTDEEAVSKVESYRLEEKATYDSTHRTLKPRHIQLIGMVAIA